jgi:hypothetical protein
MIDRTQKFKDNFAVLNDPKKTIKIRPSRGGLNNQFSGENAEGSGIVPRIMEELAKKLEHKNRAVYRPKRSTNSSSSQT